MSSSGTSVTLCCAAEDEARLSAVVEHLEREGISPSVVAGVDKDAYLLAEAVDGERGRCLFAACKSPALKAGDVLRLEGIFGARKGPHHRFVAVRMSSEDPLAMVKEIRSALSGFGAAGRKPAAPERQPAMRDVVAMTGISAVGSDARPSKSVRERMASRETPADPLAVPLHGRAAEHAARIPAHQSGGWRVEARVEETLSDKHAPLAPSAHVGGGVPPASLLPDPRPPQASRTLPILMGGILVAVIGVGVLMWRGQQSPPQAAGPPPVAAAPVAPQVQAPPPDPKPVPPPTPEVEPPEEASSGATDAEAETGDAEPVGRDEATAVAEAIANGDMRALDLILVLAPSRELPWRKASDHCRLKRVNSVKGFRLPSLQELKKLRGARMLKAGRYWSSTQTSAGSDEVYVLDQEIRKIEVVPKDSEDAVALCVRQR